MERVLKRLLRIYSVARNSTVLSNYIVPLQPVQNVIQTYSTNFTNYTKLEDNKMLTEKNHVFSNVRVTQNSTQILEMAAANYTNMSLQEALEILSALLKISKHGKNLQNIESHMGFVCLCEVLNRDIRRMKTNDIIEVLKVFTYLKIPTNTLLAQSLLQMIRATVNEISPRNLIFIVFLLKKWNSSPLRDALLIALPLVFEAQVPTKLDTEDVGQLTWSLRFANDNNIQNPEIHDIILKSLWKYRDDLDLEEAKSIFLSLCCSIYISPIGSQMLSNVQNILITRAKELNISMVMLILDKLTSVIKNKEYGWKFYNEAFIDAIINSAISSNVNFANGISLLKLLNNLNYAHIPFLEYLAAKCFEMPDLLKDASYFKVSIFLEGFINADYKPVFWDTIRDAILANEIEKKSVSRSLIKFTLNLIALDCYNPNLINKVFSYDIRSSEPMRNIYAKELLLLYQSVKTLYPMYDGQWPSQEILDYVATLKPISSEYSFRAALERALGGPQYIYNNLKTKLIHHIDHIVVMRKGGYPVAINTITSNTSDTIYIEDIQIPSESQIILIFNLPDIAYAVNSQRLKSTWLLKIKSVETLTNCNTIAINSNSWMKLAEYERVPYLMQAIKLKCEDLSVSAN